MIAVPYYNSRCLFLITHCKLHFTHVVHWLTWNHTKHLGTDGLHWEMSHVIARQLMVSELLVKLIKAAMFLSSDVDAEHVCSLKFLITIFQIMMTIAIDSVFALCCKIAHLISLSLTFIYMQSSQLSLKHLRRVSLYVGLFYHWPNRKNYTTGFLMHLHIFFFYLCGYFTYFLGCSL